MKVVAAAAGLGMLGSLLLAGLLQAQESNIEGSPAIGENSFTETQAKAWFEEAGYTRVADLVLGSDGVWRASGRLNGVPTLVRLDYQGNITTQ
jgi:hypothetical protein